MDTLYLYSLLPVLSTAVLLWLSIMLRGSGPHNLRGLALFLGAIALQMFFLLLCFLPRWAWLGQRFAAIGTFVVAGYYHAVWDLTEQPKRWLLWCVDVVAVLITATGVLYPGILYNPTTLSAGPFFWWAMALAFVGATIPAVQLSLAIKRAHGDRRRLLMRLGFAGISCFLGAWINAFLLSHGYRVPFGVFLVFYSMVMLGQIVGQVQSEITRKIIDRSLLYSALGALLSAGVLFGALSLMDGNFNRQPYSISAFFLLVMAAIAIEPLRQHVAERIGHRLLSDRANSEELARELVSVRAKTNHEERLVELGMFSSAIAHEVRNPLGVLKANLRLMEIEGSGDEELIDEMRDQIHRAEEFISDLLHYGRPRALELQWINLGDVVDLAISSVRQHRHDLAQNIRWETDLPESDVLVEADEGQLMQLMIILLDNAVLALRQVTTPHIRVTLRVHGHDVHVRIEDSGSGIPSAVEDRLFDPFVTSRPREEGGTGLGLAIASRVVERHNGTLTTTEGDLSGAAFCITLPTVHSLLS